MTVKLPSAIKLPLSKPFNDMSFAILFVMYFAAIVWQ